MDKPTNTLYRNLLIPEWDSDMEEFFDHALANLIEYSREFGFSDWTAEKPEITEIEDAYEIRFTVPGLNPESVGIEIFDNVVLLEGMRRCVVPGECNERMVFFRRVIALPNPVCDDGFHAFSPARDEVRLFLLKAQEVPSGGDRAPEYVYPVNARFAHGRSGFNRHPGDSRF